MEIVSLNSPETTSSEPNPEDYLPPNYVSGPAWRSREAYIFVLTRLGVYHPWNPKGWPDEVADKGCRCMDNHGFRMLYDSEGKETHIWVCSICEKPKPLMYYVEWCEDCGIPYVVKRLPDRLLLCSECGGE